MWTGVLRTESRNARWCGEEGPEQQRGPGGTQHAPSKQRRTNVEALRGGRSVGWCGSLCLGGGGSVPAFGVEKQPHGLVCTGTSNW